MEEVANYGFLSLVPPVVAITLAIMTRQVFLSLFLGIWIGWLVIAGGSFGTGTMMAIQGLVDVFQDAGNTRTIMFCALVGGLIVLVQRSGGVAGFIYWMANFVDNLQTGSKDKDRRWVQMLAALTGILVFVETSISSLTVGTLYRPLFDKLQISREKLAYIADSTSAPTSILIPFNGWGAFIMGLLAAQGFAQPFETMMGAMVYNFYPILTLLMVFGSIYWGKDFGSMTAAEHRVRTTGEVLNEGAQPMVSTELTETEPLDGIPHRAYNMIIPIAMMVLMMPIMLSVTGWSATEMLIDASFFEKLRAAIGAGSGSTSVLVSVLASLACAWVLYRVQGIMKTAELMDWTMKGITGLVPLALLMLLAFAISSVCKTLGTGQYVSSVVGGFLHPGLIPAIVFLISGFIAFSTGTSWGTFAIMITIGVPLAESTAAPMGLVLAAVMSGGVFGDHCSPISDTSIISSMAAATDHIDHVRTQLPYALLSGSIALVLFIIFGFLQTMA